MTFHVNILIRHYKGVSNSRTLSHGWNKIPCDIDRVLSPLSSVRTGSVVCFDSFQLISFPLCALIRVKKRSRSRGIFSFAFRRKRLLSLKGIRITVFVTLIQLEQSCHLQSPLCTLYVAEGRLLFPGRGGFPKSSTVTGRNTPSPKCFKSWGKVVQANIK